MGRLKRVMVIAVATVAACYIGLVVLVYFGQRTMIYPVPPGAERPKAKHGELLQIDAAGLGKVYALYSRPSDGAPTVVYFHGNAEQLAWQGDLSRAFKRLGVGFLAVEYPGYGLMRKTGSPSEASIYQAAEAALAHLRDQLATPPARTMLAGRSLGSGVATEMAKRGHAARLCLIAPYTSIADLGSTILPFLPARLLVRDRFDNAAKAPAIDIPVLIIHGDKDPLIPARMSRKLGTLFPHATVEILMGTAHNDIPLFSGSDLVARISTFARGEGR